MITAGRHVRRVAAASAVAAAGCLLLAAASTAGGTATVLHLRIDETVVDETSTFYCGFTVVAQTQGLITDVATFKDGARVRGHEVLVGPLVTTFSNPANGMSVEARNTAGFNLSFTATATSTVVVTLSHGLNYLVKTKDGVFTSSGSSAFGWRFTFDTSGATTGVEVLGHAYTPGLYHLAPILCTLLGAPDSDHDYLPDSQGVRTEAAFGTDPSNPDTDGDGYLDGLEVANQTDPTSALSHPQNAIGDVDKDGDFLPDGEELLFYGTDPLNPDTDGDGYLDGVEFLVYGTDPTDPNSHP